MSYKIIPTPGFEKELKYLAKKYSSLKQDITALIHSLIEDLIQGDPITKTATKSGFLSRVKERVKVGVPAYYSCKGPE